MGLMDMNRGFKKYAPYIMGALAIPFIASAAFFGLGMAGGAGTGSPASAPGNAGDSEKAVANIGGTPVTRRTLDQKIEMAFRQQAMMGMPSQPNPADMDRFRVLSLNGIKQEVALAQAAKAANVSVTDADLNAGRDKIWAQQKAQVAQALGLKAEATDTEIESALGKQQPGLTVATLKMRVPEEDLRNNLYSDGLLAGFKKQVKADEAAVKKTYDDVQVRHILIKFGEGGITEAQAKDKAQKLLDQIKAAPPTMAALATQNTDDPGSKAKGGFYDWAPAGQYVPEFTEAALTAGVGKVYPELVRVVAGNYSGFHIVKLEGERPGKSLPKDWDKAKQKYIDQYIEKAASQKMQGAIMAIVPTLKVDITDPGMKAAQLEDEARPLTDKTAKAAKLNLALTELAKITKVDDPSGAVPLRKARIYEELGKTTEAVAAYQEALTFRNAVETRFALAQLYLKNKDKASALKQLAEAEKLPMGDVTMQFQLGSLYTAAGNAAKAKAAQTKAGEMLQRQRQLDQAAQKATLPPGPPPGPATNTKGSPAPKASSAPKASPAPSATK